MNIHEQIPPTPSFPPLPVCKSRVHDCHLYYTHLLEGVEVVLEAEQVVGGPRMLVKETLPARCHLAAHAPEG